MVKCNACNFENFSFLPDVYKMLLPQGLSCQKCGRIVYAKDAKYICFNTSNISNDKYNTFEGWHIPQIFTPQNTTPAAWKSLYYDIIEKQMDEYTLCTEVLGNSMDSGGKPTTLAKLQSLVVDRPMKYSSTFLGVDWGCSAKASLTVVCVLGVTNTGRYEVIDAIKFKHRDRLEQIKVICELYKKYKCFAIGVDSGVGLTDNIILKQRIVGKILEYMYTVAHNYTIRYSREVDIYNISKSKVLNLIFHDINNGYITFKKEVLKENVFDDILSIYEIVNSHGHKLYEHNKSVPDDFLHAMNFALITAKLANHDTIFCSYLDEGEIV
jgi:hypothetical protein